MNSKTENLNFKQMIDIETATHKELLAEYDKCQKEWGKWSCDSFGYYIMALYRRITELGGWPTR